MTSKHLSGIIIDFAAFQSAQYRLSYSMYIPQGDPFMASAIGSRFNALLEVARLCRLLHKRRNLVLNCLVVQSWSRVSLRAAHIPKHVRFPISTPAREYACVPFRSVIFSRPNSYRAHTLGCTSKASRIMIGVCGLWCFIVGYARVRNDL